MLKIFFSLAILITAVSCASINTATPEAMSRLKYGMDLSEVNNALENKGGLIFRGLRSGKHYLGVYYEVEETYRKYCLIFEEDLLVGVIRFEDFQKAWAENSFKATTFPGAVLHYEEGFDDLHNALAQNLIKLDKIDFAPVDMSAREEAKRQNLAGINEALAWSWLIVPLSPILVPGLIVDANRSEEFDKLWGQLSLRLSKQSVFGLLGRPHFGRTNRNLDYEVLIYEGSEKL